MRTIWRGAVTACALLLLSACTVRPLYMASPDAPGGAASELYSIEVNPVSTRYEQEVRTQLIFLLTGGAARTPDPAYTMDLQVARRVAKAADIQAGEIDEPTAKTLTLIANYAVTEIATGDRIARGRRAITSSYDVPRQLYAEARAERDAEDRAARELAEALHLALAQDLFRVGRERRVLVKDSLREPDSTLREVDPSLQDDPTL